MQRPQRSSVAVVLSPKIQRSKGMEMTQEQSQQINDGLKRLAVTPVDVTKYDPTGELRPENRFSTADPLRNFHPRKR